MRATLSDNIRIPLAEIPDSVRAAIEVALTVPNPAKAEAEAEMLWGANRIDPHLRLYTTDASDLVLPMGFLSALIYGCSAMNTPLDLLDYRSRGWPLPQEIIDQPITMRDYQEPMCLAMWESELGIGEAPTAAGKTAVTLEAIRRIGRSAIILVEKTSLAKQWAEAIEEFFGYKAAMFGGKKYETGAITVALRQSIMAQKDTLPDEFWSYFGTVVVDEAHHAATAWTLIDILQRFTSRHRLGATATPKRNAEYFPILQAVLGPVVWTTTIEDAEEHLVIPSVRVLESNFAFHFTPTKSRTERNNYGAMMQELCADRQRNVMIGAAAVMEARAGHHVLIVSDRTEHLNNIGDAIIDWASSTVRGQHAEVDVHMLTGKSGDYLAIKHAIETAESGSILLSTVAEEGLSINRLDRVIPAYPRSNPEAMKQIAGRVMRPWPGKVDAQIIDIRDGQQFLLRKQFQARAQQLYVKEGWSIERSE